MPLADAFPAVLPYVLAGLAVVLGVASKVLAARLILGYGQAANDPIYQRSYRTRLRPGERRPYPLGRSAS